MDKTINGIITLLMYVSITLSALFILIFGFCSIYLFGNIISYSFGSGWASLFWGIVLAGLLSTIGLYFVFSDDNFKINMKRKKWKR